MFSNMRLKNILVMSNITFAVTTILLSLLFIVSVITIGRSLDDVAKNTVPSVMTLADINSDTHALMAKMGSHILAPTTAETMRVDADVPAYIKAVDDGFIAYRSLISDETDKKLFDTALSRWQTAKAEMVNLRALSIAMNTEAATALYNKRLVPATDAMTEAVRADMEYNNKLMLESEHAGENAAMIGKIVTIVAMLAGGAVAAFLTMLSFRRIINPLTDLTGGLQAMAAGKSNIAIAGADSKDEIGDIVRAVDGIKANIAEKAEREAATQQRVVDGLTEGLSALAQGNLTYQITDRFDASYDQLRQNFNSTVANLEQNIRQVATSARSVHTGASEIRSASEDLAHRTEQQAASLEETSAAMSQVTTMVTETAKSANEVRAAAGSARKNASDGGNVVRQAIGAMAAIEKSSQEINNIISVIDGISFKTNLLALNAGVEAARAGDAGKGFAVVANEVRALAQNSADAAKEIKDLITNSNTQVTQGVHLVGETGKMLENIAEKVGEIDDLITEIASGTERQAVNLQQVNSTVLDMDKMTQQNAAMVEESSAASCGLATEADELSGLVSRFRIGSAVAAKPAASPTPAPARPARPARPAAAKAAPKIRGNLALKASTDADDWENF